MSEWLLVGLLGAAFLGVLALAFWCALTGRGHWIGWLLSLWDRMEEEAQCPTD